MVTIDDNDGEGGWNLEGQSVKNLQGRDREGKIYTMHRITSTIARTIRKREKGKGTVSCAGKWQMDKGNKLTIPAANKKPYPVSYPQEPHRVPRASKRLTHFQG